MGFKMTWPQAIVDICITVSIFVGFCYTCYCISKS